MLIRRLLVCVPVVLAVLVSGCAVDPQISLERRENERISVDGHELVERNYAQGAYSIFVGPWSDDPLPLVRQPGVRLVEPQRSYLDLSTEIVGEGTFYEPGGQRCRTEVERLRRGIEPYWDMADETRDAVRGGGLEALKVLTVCEGSG